MVPWVINVRFDISREDNKHFFISEAHFPPHNQLVVNTESICQFGFL